MPPCLGHWDHLLLHREAQHPVGQGKAGSSFGVCMSRVKRLGASIWVVLHFKCQSADMWGPGVVGLGGLVVKLRIQSWDPVAEEWYHGQGTGSGISVLGSSALG